ncbi:MAG TPA: phosphotransferase [Candidatus Angelobacter sp.]|nr:phosphotransferase [Candidatus Angelobacter sp.]
MTITPGARIGSGRTADVHAVDGERVVKVLRHGFPDALGEAEARAARLVSRTGIAAPRLLGTTRIDGRFSLIYERREGASMLDVLVERPWAYRRFAAEFAGIHAATHLEHASALPSLRSRIESAIQRTDVPQRIRDAALRRLGTLPDGDALLHGDMHPGNILLTAEGPTIIDWEAAAAGPPAAGVAHTLFLLHGSELPPGVSAIRRHAITLLRGAFSRAYLRAYRRVRPLDADEVRAWRLPILVARLDDGIAAERRPLHRLIQQDLR